jgi:uncharacterized sporulation protein YeaH/YhbH (DUF444 family)
MTVVDRRKSGKNKSVENRQKFLKRYKHRLKRSIEDLASDKGITDVLKERKVVIDPDEINEPNFNFDLSTGERDVILPGNKTMQKGDKVRRPPQSDEQGSGGSDSGEGLDEFTFTLTKEEFLDLYFSDMELPNFVKESLKSSTKVQWKRTGYSKEGIPPRLDLVKTLKQAMARRIATKQTTTLCPACWKELKTEKCGNCGVYSEGVPGDKPQRYLDDIDLRYKHFTKQPYPVRHATMICLMDVSASMGEADKSIAKKFFLLLYLFLHKVYKTVDVIFVSHTHEAKEVSEQEFFYGQETGGTIVSSGLNLVNQIDSRIDLTTTNVYISQASDGDTWDQDDVEPVLEQLLDKVQYFAYIQTEEYERHGWGVPDLLTIYKKVAERHQNLQCRHVAEEREVYSVLRSLFEKRI